MTMNEDTLTSIKWIRNYIRLAEEISMWSKDPRTKCGAIAVGKYGSIISQGYNGFPRGVKDYPERYTNREKKYKYVVHAEMNCIYNAALNGSSMNGADIYVYGLPVCSECAKGIIQIGVRKVFMKYPEHSEHVSEKWIEAFEDTKEMFEEANVEYYTL